MMGSQEGRPFCVNAGVFLVEQGGNQNLLKQCRECKAIRFIGCPGFKYKLEDCDKDVNNWVHGWYYNEPIEDKAS